MLCGRADEFLVYAGTSTSHGSKGIYAWRFQTSSGKLSPLGVAAATGNPTFLVLHPSQRFLYAVNENGGADVLGTVSAYAIDPRSGKLSALNWVSSKGGAPCHMAIDSGGKWLAVANCAGGVAVLPVLADGRLGEATSVPATHARGVVFAPDNAFLLAASDDGIRAYRFDNATGALGAASLTPAATARRLVFHPSGQALYALGESTVTAFHFDPHTGGLAEFQHVSTLPEDFTGTAAASAVAINTAGKVMYVAVPGLQALAQFAVDSQTLTLTPMEFPPSMGRAPRGLAFDPTDGYLFVANQDSADLTVFRVHPHTGQLQPASAIGKHVPDPACVLFVPVL